MVEEKSLQDAVDPMHFTSRIEDLTLFRGEPKQLLLLESTAANAPITTASRNPDTALTQDHYGTPPPRICATTRQLRKRTHAPAPDERIQDGVALKNVHTRVLFKKWKPEEYALVQYLNVADEPMGDSDQHWDVEWNRRSARWPTTASVGCPLVGSETAIWAAAAAAAAEPDCLLDQVQLCRFSGELINSLADSVIVQWTEKWRRECLQHCLARYRTNSPSKATRAWLDQWMQQITMLQMRKAAGNIGDNADSWKRIRVNKYGKDDLLRLCDPVRRVKFSHHTLCAHLYLVEIEELLSVTDTGASSRTVMEAHVQLLQKDAKYHSGYYGDGKQANWASIAHYFEAAFEKPMAIKDADY
ncbi:unnamed protein product [Peronospora destructor]|uniref:Uncharacterized protein n=1 Tax=Peronospora destructor TaxID=86335 RepID=A0AAV0VEC7_9STRA|nr:unnamed protein product [Peronospora destructor]